MKRVLLPLILLLVVLLAVGMGVWCSHHYPQSWAQYSLRFRSALGLPTGEHVPLTASGFIEVDHTKISPEVGGQIVALNVDEGDRVVEGQVLLMLDQRLWQADVQAAEASIAVANAQLAQVKAGAAQEDIEVARAAVHLAQAQLTAATEAVSDTLLLQAYQQDLDLEIIGSQNQTAISLLALDQVIPLKDAAELAEGLAHRQVDFAEAVHHKTVFFGGKKYRFEFTFDEGTKRQASAGWNSQGTQLWQAWVAIETAQTGIENAQQHLDNLRTLRAQPLTLQLATVQAQAAQQQAVAAIPVAEASMQVVGAGATEEQIALAGAQVDQAQAALDALQVQAGKYEIRAPISGQVIEQPADLGEIVLPRTTLMTLANIDVVRLTVYVPEADMGGVSLGQSVQVTVDTFPDKSFGGQVASIADEAEFTPKNVQTSAERASTVFAVKVEIPNPDHLLKPGMPADAQFVE